MKRTANLARLQGFSEHRVWIRIPHPFLRASRRPAIDRPSSFALVRPSNPAYPEVMFEVAVIAALLVIAAVGVRAFFRASQVMIPPDVIGDDSELTPVDRAVRDASASGFDMQ